MSDEGLIRGLSGFIRLGICLSATLFGIVGFYMFSGLGYGLIWTALSSFLVCAGAYSINNIVDREEDAFSRRGPSVMAGRRLGKVVCALLFVGGFIPTLALSPESQVFYLAAAGTSMAYSVLRLKRFFMLKNLYTGFGVMQVFLIGAAASGIPPMLPAYYAAFSVFIMAGSMISDMRDMESDRRAGNMTLPVRTGEGTTKWTVISLLSVHSLAVILFLPSISVIIPFSFLISLMVLRGNVRAAHSTGPLPFIFILAGLVL